MKIKSKNKIAFILLFFVVFSIFPYNHAKADIWGSAMMSAGFTEMMKKIDTMIRDTLMGALKQAALQTITKTVSNAVSGGGSGPLFVTNWETFLINDPRRKADLYMNDFFSGMTRGRGSSSNYSGLTGSLFSSRDSNSKVAGASIAREGIVKGDYTEMGNYSSSGGDYQESLVSEGKNETVDATIPSCNLTSVSSSNMFKLSTLSTIFGNDACNKPGVRNISKGVYLSEIEKQQKVSATEGVANQGYKSVKSGDSIVTPGSTVGAIQAQNEDLGNKMLAGATSMPEVLTSLISRLAVQTLQKGIGQAQSYAQSSSNKTTNISQQMQSQSNPSKAYQIKY